MSRNRVSVAWATPGLNPDSNLDLTTVDETFIEEDEEDEETEDEEGDVETTPKESKAVSLSDFYLNFDFSYVSLVKKINCKFIRIVETPSL